jgi:hypothetical protein
MRSSRSTADPLSEVTRQVDVRATHRGAAHRPASAVFVVLWLLTFAALQWSVVRYRVLIVVVLTVATLALLASLARRQPPLLERWSVAAILAGGAVAGLAVPVFSYLPDTAERVAVWVLAVAAVAAAVLVLIHRYAAAALAAVVGHVTVVATAVITDPAPRIDVWVTLQQASDALARGENFYDMAWSGSPGIQDAFTYLPWTAVLLAPGRVALGDVRWMQLGWTLVLVTGVWLLATQRCRAPDDRLRAAGVVAILLLVPGTLTQVDQAWTEPLLLTGVVWWAVLVRSGRPWWAVLPLALACASKQHLVLLLPVLLVWRSFGWRRTLAVAGLASLLVLPWFVASPADFVHDTVTLLVGFHAITFSNTLYLFAVNTVGVTPPFWLTGLAVATALAGATWAVQRRQPDLGEVLRWCALVLAVASLVNKQAFYNQYWLVAALVLVSLAVGEARRRSPRETVELGQP